MTAQQIARPVSTQSRALDLVVAMAAWLPQAEVLPGWERACSVEDTQRTPHDEH